MNRLDVRMVEAWRQAADDLGIVVISPFETQGEDGTRIDLEGFLPDFGAPTGMAFISFGRRIKAQETGIYTSVLFQDYRKYRRSLFIDTLNDWGWFGASDQRPSWYTAEPWR